MRANMQANGVRQVMKASVKGSVVIHIVCLVLQLFPSMMLLSPYLTSVRYVYTNQSRCWWATFNNRTTLARSALMSIEYCPSVDMGDAVKTINIYYISPSCELLSLYHSETKHKTSKGIWYSDTVCHDVSCILMECVIFAFNGWSLSPSCTSLPTTRGLHLWKLEGHDIEQRRIANCL